MSVWFRDWDSGHDFCVGWDDSTDKGEFEDSIELVGPFLRETSKYANVEAFVP